MAQRTIMMLYDGYDAVLQIAHRLELAGVADRDISVITSNSDSRFPVLAEAAQRGASPLPVGAAIGGTLGLCYAILLEIGAPGLPALALPALGPIIRAGWVAALLAGAAAGAAGGLVLGGAAWLVLRRDPALVYAEGISRGNTLLTVRVPDTIAPRVETLMGIGDDAAPAAAPRAPAEVGGHGRGGWSRYKPGLIVTPVDLAVERRRIHAANARIQHE